MLIPFDQQLATEEASASTTSHLEDTLFDELSQQAKYQRVVYYLRLALSTPQEQEQQQQTTTKKQQPLRSSSVFNSGRGSMLNYQAVTDVSLDANYESSAGSSDSPPQRAFSALQVLETLLAQTELADPSWHELNNYTSFVDSQLVLAEQSAFLAHIDGLKTVCVRLVLIMASDFGTPSLRLVDEDYNNDENNTGNNNSANVFARRFEIDERRRWEHMLHPYIFMNADGGSITFMGLYLNRTTKQFVNPNTGQVLTKTLDARMPTISSVLFIKGFLGQRVPVFDNFNAHSRDKKLIALCTLMSLNANNVLRHDPDPAYELTLDNCLKITAIYLRLACAIPVCVMGETGCGKSRLVEFFSRLLLSSASVAAAAAADDHQRQHQHVAVRNMLVHVKMHGGTSVAHIREQLAAAESLARKNFTAINQLNGVASEQAAAAAAGTGQKNSQKENSKLITAVLFFDEANTSEHVGLVKEIMCDATCMGEPIEALRYGLKIIAAINPYRKHSAEMIQKLEASYY